MLGLKLQEILAVIDELLWDRLQRETPISLKGPTKNKPKICIILSPQLPIFGPKCNAYSPRGYLFEKNNDSAQIKKRVNSNLPWLGLSSLC